MTDERRIPTGRLDRFAQMGRLAGRIALNTAVSGAREYRQGRRPALNDLLMSPANLEQLGERLAEMRGAAMKLGQLLSMESGEVLPAELTRLLERLREKAYAMPWQQLDASLEQAWGANWQKQFSWLSAKPLAAASIGQVHEAQTRDGQRLAIKIQYPGIADSIDSDLRNLASLLRVFKLLPAGLELDPLLATARAQLLDEADYRKEAAYLGQFASRVGTDPRFELPVVVHELSTDTVLAMTYLDGKPIESVQSQPPALRAHVGSSLIDLALSEVCHWGLVQTDTNFANYRYQPATQRVQLLDFGAARHYSIAQRQQLTDLMQAASDGQDSDLLRAAAALGYLQADDPADYQGLVLALLRLAAEPLRADGDYDFGRSDLARRMSEIVVDMRLRQGFARVPPAEILFLHRKLGGLYMLLNRIGARVPVRALGAAVLAAGNTPVAAQMGA